ncbi:MAG: carboxypeptidase-like regulatory domain-containing protein [Sulfurovum sp.]
MNKLIVSILVIVSSLVMVGCGGNNSGETFLNQLRTVSGSVVDGPISGAVVKIFGVDENSSILYGTTTTDENGSFSIEDIANLPAVYRVVVTDGKDNGVDTKADSNDENLSFEMSAMVNRDNDDSNDSIANVSPATTLVDNIVEDGIMPLGDAQKAVAKSFGLDENTILAKLDNKKNSLGNKVGNLVGFLTKISPIKDKNIVIKAIVKLIVKKSINVSVTDMKVDIDNLDLGELLSEINKTSPDTMSPDDIAKIKETQMIIKENLVKLLEKIKPADAITDNEAKDATSYKIALDALLSEIQLLTSTEIDSDELMLLVAHTQNTIKALLNDNNTDETTTPENIEFVLSLIKANLYQNITDVKNFVIKVSTDYKIIIKKIDGKDNLKSKHHLKNMIKLIYKNCDMNRTDDIKTALDDDSILEEIDTTADDINKTAILETGEMPNELSNELQDIVADQIASKIEDGNISAESIKTVSDNSVRNPYVVEAIKIRVEIKIKIRKKAKKEKLSKDDNIEYIASKEVIKNIKIHVKVREFTESSKNNCKHYENNIKMTLKTSTKIKIKIKIKAIHLNVVNLDSTDLSIPQNLIDLIERLKVDSNIDFLKSSYKIKIKIKTDFIKIKVTIKFDIQFIINDIDAHIEDYTVPFVPPVRVLSLPQPSLPNMPTEFAPAIEVTI